MDAQGQLPPPPPPGPSPRSRGHHTIRAHGIWLVLGAMIAAYAGAATLMSRGANGVTTQADICERADALIAMTESGVDDTTRGLPRDLVPADLAAAFPGSELRQPGVLLSSADIVRETIPEAGAWFVELDEQDFRIGWVQPLSYQGLDLSVKAEEFASHRQAVAYSRWLALNVNCHYSNEVFTGPVPGSLGFQIRWRSGDIGEQLSFVRGDLRYTVAVVGPERPADHSLVDRLAEEVARVDPP